MQKILCVEDADESIAILEQTLKDYDLTIVKTLAEAVDRAAVCEFELILLDIGLPDGSGFEFMSKTISNKTTTPVIFLTGKSDFASKACAFSLGAEDFVVKPFDPLDLKLRVDARIKKRERQISENNFLRFGDLVCHLEEHRVVNRSTGKAIDLTSLEFKILTLLIRRPGKIFSRSELLDRAWGDSVSVSERSVDVHISNLRKKLSGTDSTIDGVVGSGYRMQSK